jgi:hypothetical protein
MNINLFEEFKSQVVISFAEQDIILTEADGVYHRVQEFLLNEDGEKINVIKRPVIDDTYKRHGIVVLFGFDAAARADYAEWLKSNADQVVFGILTHAMAYFYDVTFEYEIGETGHLFTVYYWCKINAQ